MKQNKVFDDISRVLASPMPRRRALKLIVGALAGGSLMASGLGRAEAAVQVTCTPSTCSAAGSIRCSERCCCPPGFTCCRVNEFHYVCCGHWPPTTRCVHGRCVS